MSGTLPAWMERWLGLANGPGEGTAWRLHGQWPWPPWLTLLGILAIVALVVAVYLREGRQTGRRYRLTLAALRLAAVGIVVLMIAQVELLLHRTGLPYVAVVIDDSQSMTLVDSYTDSLRAAIKQRLAEAEPGGSDELSRWRLARSLWTEGDGELPRELAENYKLRFYFLTGPTAIHATQSDGIVEELLATEPTGASTRLGSAVRAVLDDLRGTAPAAIILVTDGINTEGPSLTEAAATARRKGVPLFFVGVGSDQPIRELKLSDLDVANVVYLGDVVRFGFKLTATGFEGKKAAIVLRQDGHPEPLARIEATLGPDGQPQDIRLPYRPAREGEFRYTIDVEPLEGGLQTRNPPLSAEIQVRKDKKKIRVLLVQAYPNFEYRFLRNLLARDETIELHTVLQEADVEYADQDKAALRVFPVRRDELFAYDVVILGDANPGLLGPAALQNLADFVDQEGHGGALVLVAGSRFMPQAYRDTPLASLMPFDPAAVRVPEANKPLTEGFAVQPTELGMATSAMQLADTPEESRAAWSQLPPLYWMVEATGLKRGAAVLAEHPTRTGADGKHLPLILKTAGTGRVVFHATDETYRWRRHGSDALFGRYWIQLIRNLSRSKLADGDRPARLRTDRVKYQSGDPVRIEVRFLDERLAPADEAAVTVFLQRQGGKISVQLRRCESSRATFEAAVAGLPVGEYHASIASPSLGARSPTARFTIALPEEEMARKQMDAAEMRRAAELSKGRYYPLVDAEQLAAELPAGRHVPIENLPPMTLWNRWPVLLVFLGLLTAEWLLRKRGGMV